VQIRLIFEVAHGDLDTSPYTPLQTFVLYIYGQKRALVALVIGRFFQKNGRLATFLLVSVQIALVFEVAHGDINTSPYTPC
jgi:hypothetical protein